MTLQEREMEEEEKEKEYEHEHGMTLKGFHKFEKEVNKQGQTREERGEYIPTEGKFINMPDKAFAVQIQDDQQIMRKFRDKLDYVSNSF